MNELNTYLRRAARDFLEACAVAGFVAFIAVIAVAFAA